MKTHYDLIKVLCNPKYRTAILVHADKGLINAICEIVNNVLRNNINISESDKAKLIKHRKFLRELCEKSSLREKKENPDSKRRLSAIFDIRRNRRTCSNYIVSDI
jgi:hypothetical protein